MAKNKILILDDEKKYLALHKFFLEEAGFECICTSFGSEAVEIALTDMAIKVALVDEILYTEEKQTQDLQGEDVREEIRTQRNDINFMIITSKAEIEAKKVIGGDVGAILQVWNEVDTKLRREPNVAGVFHKQRLDNPGKQQDEYNFLIKAIKELLQDKTLLANPLVKTLEIPSLIIGIGVPAELLNEIDEQGNTKTFTYKTVRNFLINQAQGYKPSEAEIDRQVKNLQKEFQSRYQDKIEKKIFFVKSGTSLSKRQELKKRVPGKKKFQPVIKSGTRPFEILEWLAWKAESRETPPTINGEEFLYDIQGKPRYPSGTGKTTRSALGKEQGQSSVEIHNFNPRAFHNLTVAINRDLCRRLIEANIGIDSQQYLFRCYEGETKYEALFETGIVLYAKTTA